MMVGLWARLGNYVGRKVWDEDVRSLHWPRRLLINTLRLGYVLGREVYEGHLTLRATSLVYTSFLSFVPLLAVSFSVLKAFGVQYQLEPLLRNFLAPLGPKGDQIVQNITHFIQNIRVGVLGSVGLALLLYTVVSLVQQTEDAFNFIWRVKNLRGFMHRFSDYLSVILVGPVLIFSALGLAATVMGTDVVKGLAEFEPFGTLIYFTGRLIPYVLVVAALVFVYVFLPNTKVRFSSAVVGAVFAVALWQITGWLFASFAVASGRYEAIYSGFALVLLFMIWLYLVWLILLIGAQVAFYHQYPQFVVRNKEALILGHRLKEQLALMVMFLIAENFYHNRRPWTFEALVQRLELPLEPLRKTLEALEEKGFVVVVGSDPVKYLPAKAPDILTLKEFISAIRRNGQESCFPCSVPQVGRLWKRLDTAIGSALGNETLKDLVVAEEEN